MSRASELADKFAMSKFASSADREAAMLDELRRLERVNAELVEALELFRKTLKAKAVCYWSDPETEADLKALAALTSATKETKE